MLLACIRDINSNTDLCLVRKLQALHSPSGCELLNEFDCPLLELTNEVYAIPSPCVIKSVSVVHMCSDSCVFVETTTQHLLEREVVQDSKLTFRHDFSNNMFCYNIFCTNNN